MKSNGQSKLNEALIDDLCKLIRDGNFVQTACRAKNITFNTFYTWKRNGRILDEELSSENGRRLSTLTKREILYFKFYKAIEKAEAELELQIVEQAREALAQKPELNFKFLSRRFPERWSKKTVVATADINEKSDKGGVDYSKLSTELLKQIESELESS